MQTRFETKTIPLTRACSRGLGVYPYGVIPFFAIGLPHGGEWILAPFLLFVPVAIFVLLVRALWRK